MWLLLKLALVISTTSPATCANYVKGEFIGCYFGGDRPVFIQDGMTKNATDYVAFHESAHHLGVWNENEADYFAKKYMQYSGVPNYQLTMKEIFPEKK